MEQTALVEEKVKPEEIQFTGTIPLTNSKKVGFGRRDLALCFYPLKIVEKADRHYEVATIDGRIIPLDNPRIVRRIWETVQKRFIYDGTWKKKQTQSFDWFKIIRRLKHDYNLESFSVAPERHKIITQIQITTKAKNFEEHERVVNEIWEKIRINAPHLTMQKAHCTYNITGVCQIPQGSP